MTRHKGPDVWHYMGLSYRSSRGRGSEDREVGGLLGKDPHAAHTRNEYFRSSGSFWSLQYAKQVLQPMLQWQYEFL